MKLAAFVAVLASRHARLSRLKRYSGKSTRQFPDFSFRKSAPGMGNLLVRRRFPGIPVFPVATRRYTPGPRRSYQSAVSKHRSPKEGGKSHDTPREKRELLAELVAYLSRSHVVDREKAKYREERPRRSLPWAIASRGAAAEPPSSDTGTALPRRQEA